MGNIQLLRRLIVDSLSQVLPFTFEDLQIWYNGYHTVDGVKLYNPWSIARALTEKEVRCYWVESGNHSSARFVGLY